MLMGSDDLYRTASSTWSLSQKLLGASRTLPTHGPMLQKKQAACGLRYLLQFC